ncbi:MAG: hypothetical protein ACOY71_11940 [Gemmatimonadota bacterium]
MPSDQYLRVVRRLAPAPNGGFWSARWLFMYELTLWDSNGTMRRRLIPQAGWYRPYDVVRRPTTDAPPQAAVSGLWEDAEGRLWVLGFAPDPRWRRGLGPVTTVEGRPSQPVLDRDAVFDTVIDVFDLGSNTLLATHRIDAVYQFVVAPGVIAGVREDDDGNLRVEVVRATLGQPATRRMP